MAPQPLTASRSTADSSACEITSNRSSGSCAHAKKKKKEEKKKSVDDYAIMATWAFVRLCIRVRVRVCMDCAVMAKYVVVAKRTSSRPVQRLAHTIEIRFTGAKVVRHQRLHDREVFVLCACVLSFECMHTKLGRYSDSHIP